MFILLKDNTFIDKDKSYQQCLIRVFRLRVQKDSITIRGYINNNLDTVSYNPECYSEEEALNELAKRVKSKLNSMGYELYKLVG
jgi:hypothetical protein